VILASDNSDDGQRSAGDSAAEVDGLGEIIDSLVEIPRKIAWSGLRQSVKRSLGS
jgi:hypothetical protein